MGNRSDIQCRYHYNQLLKDMPKRIPSKRQFPPFTGTRNPPAPIRPVFQGITTRYSMPLVQQRIATEPQQEDLPPAPRRRVSQGVVPAAQEFAAAETATVLVPPPAAVPAVAPFERPVHRVSLPGIETLTSLLKGWQ
jgi:hypothetical protein